MTRKLTITRERLEEIRDYDTCVTLDESAELARMALAAMDSEPVAWTWQYREQWHVTSDPRRAEFVAKDGDVAVLPLYRHAQQPVMPDESYQHLSELYHAQEKRLFKLLKRVKGPEFDKYSHTPLQAIDFLESAFFGDSEDDVRAATLQAGNCPALTVWYGYMPETNGKTNWTAILHRKGECLSTGITIDRSEYPDRVRYEADRMRHLIGELEDEPDILEYDADAHSGYVTPAQDLNSPVIPDGSKEALSEAVAAIYFTDSTDYLPALYSVVKALSPEVFAQLLSNEKAAFDATRLPAAPAGGVQ